MSAGRRELSTNSPELARVRVLVSWGKKFSLVKILVLRSSHLELLRFQKECHRKMQTARLLIWIIYTDGTHKLQQDLWLLKVVTNLKLEIFEFREFKFARASVEPHSTWMIIQNRQLAFWRVTAFNREVRESDWSSGVLQCTQGCIN